jgi:hypothetical protein
MAVEITMVAAELLSRSGLSRERAAGGSAR